MSSVMVEEARSMVMKQAGSLAAMTQATMASMSSATAGGASMMAATMTGGGGAAAVAPICSNTCDKVCIPVPHRFLEYVVPVPVCQRKGHF